MGQSSAFRPEERIPFTLHLCAGPASRKHLRRRRVDPLPRFARSHAIHCRRHRASHRARRPVGRLCVSLSRSRAGAGPAPAQNLPDAPGVAGLVAGCGEPDAAPAGPAAPAMIAGTVLDTNGDVVEGARVVLSGTGRRAGPRAHLRQQRASSRFTGLPPDTYRLTVSRAGMGTFTSPHLVELHCRRDAVPEEGGAAVERGRAGSARVCQPGATGHRTGACGGEPARAGRDPEFLQQLRPACRADEREAEVPAGLSFGD